MRQVVPDIAAVADGYQGHQVRRDDDTLGDVALFGPAVLAGAGIDFVRFKWAVFGAELATSATLNRDGVLIASGIHLGLAFD